VQLVIEDYVTPEDLAAEFDRAGLSGLVYLGDGRAPWPALRTLIDTRQRVVVMTESGRAGVPWNPPAFDVMGRPHNSAIRRCSCAANRGAQGRCSRSRIDCHDARAETEQRRHQAPTTRCWPRLALPGNEAWPTILAVDFYRTGDVVGVARALNR
jgi:hypothetical protein